MSRLKRVSSLCDRSQDLAILGYSEEMIDNLIRNGDLQGGYNTKTGEMMIDKSEVENFSSYPLQLLKDEVSTKGGSSRSW